MRTLRFAAFAALLTGLAAGCGSSNTPASVKGKVTYKGEPLPGGSVTFMTDNGSYSTSIQSDGSYSAKDLPVGGASILIDTEAFNPNAGTDPNDKKLSKKQKQYAQGEAASRKQREEFEGIKTGAGGKSGGFGPASPEELAKLYRKIPAKYGDKRTSGLRMDVVRGEQTKDIDLTD